ncbi:MAG TPA: TetR/AcrR family transcriptional regulator [Acidimicrobiales bacterium]|jgi:AcrR family transcriptional regulator|nr:TetR/AcrR family transcriptional regulator [Acidimicrobiales bacterium]
MVAARAADKVAASDVARSSRATPAEDPSERKIGRPRDPNAAEAIINATMEVLSEQGFGGMTVDAVAARAGVGKATIYRRFSSKTHLALAVASAVLPEPEVPDTGTVRGDLLALFLQSHGDEKPEAHMRLMAAVFAEAMVNPEVRDVLGEFVEGRRGASKAVVERARARGELSADADAGQIADMISGTLLYQNLVRGQATDPNLVEHTVDVVLRAFRP